MGKLTATLLLGLAALGACANPVPPPPPRPPLADGEAAPIRRIESGVLRGLMTSGALRVEPDGGLAAAIGRVGDRPLLTIVTVCLDAAGAATGGVTRPSRVPEFDDAALAVVATWRFRPYQDGGTSTPACGFAAFRHGEPVASTDVPVPPNWNDALPAPTIELPPSVYVSDRSPTGGRTQKPTPGVAVARVCRRRGSMAAPEIAWLQSSGDPVFDRDLFERRATVATGEPADGEWVCSIWSATAWSPGDAALAPILPPMAMKEFAAGWISGNRNIFPADDLKETIWRSNVHQFTVPVKVCLDDTGRAASVSLLGTSGYLGYDMDVINAVAAWRYQPFMLDGQPAPVCGIVKFNYRQS